MSDQRIIKFKGQRTDTKEWVYGSLVIADMTTIEDRKKYLIVDSSNLSLEVIPETIGQFVCLDKAGNDIYDGDKVRDPKNNIGTVFWHQTKFLIEWKSRNHEGHPEVDDCFEYTVLIGNIHEEKDNHERD